MRVLYEAENLIDAHLVRGLLEQAGIPAWVRGEYLTGGIGELPVSGLLAVCVPDAAWAEAGRCLAAWQRAVAAGEERADEDEGLGDAAAAC